jgi:hypothetical protein
LKSDWPFKIAQIIVDGIWESIHQSSLDKQYGVIDHDTLPIISTWLTFLENRVSDFPTKWKNMNKL